MSVGEEIARTLHAGIVKAAREDRISIEVFDETPGFDFELDLAKSLTPLLNRVRAEARAEGIRGAAEAVHAEARWQQEQVMRGAVQKSGAETTVERLLVVEELLRQQADHWEQNSEGNET